MTIITEIVAILTIVALSGAAMWELARAGILNNRGE
jgi:hypothetical protein